MEIDETYPCRHFGCGVVCTSKLGRAYHEQLNHPHITNMYDISQDISSALNDMMSVGNEAFSLQVSEQIQVKNEKMFLDGYT